MDRIGFNLLMESGLAFEWIELRIDWIDWSCDASQKIIR